MWPFKYFPFQVLSCGAIYCAVNAILIIDCSNENCASVFVTLLVLLFLKRKLLALIQSSFSWNIPANSLGATAMTWRRQQRATGWRSAPKRKATIIMKSQRFRQSSARNRVPGNVLLISYRSKSLYLRLYICATQIEGTSCVAYKFKMFNFILQKNVYFSDYAKKSPSWWLSLSLVQLCIQLARVELFFQYSSNSMIWNCHRVQEVELQLLGTYLQWAEVLVLKAQYIFPLYLMKNLKFKTLKIPLSLNKKWP